MCCCLGTLGFLAARSRTYFWREGADAAVDYGLGRADVRGDCCFGHGVQLCGAVDVGLRRGEGAINDITTSSLKLLRGDDAWRGTWALWWGRSQSSAKRFLTSL